MDRVKHSVYWRDTGKAEPRPALAEDFDCDICVVGGGYTGLWSALLLREASPGAVIALAEARETGAGASGHNDGFVTQALGGQDLASLTARFGPEPAAQAYAALSRAAVELARFCVRNDLDAEFEARGVLSVATSPAEVRKIEDRLRGAADGAAEILYGPDIQAKINSPVILAGYRHGGGLINPFKLALGLAHVAQARGVRIFDGTPVLELAEGQRGVTLRTPGGVITAGAVVLATDAYQDLVPALARSIRLVRSYALVTEPLGEAQAARLCWPNREGIVDNRAMSVFARLTWDRRILLGGGYASPTRRMDRQPSRIPSARAQRWTTMIFRRMFPMLADVDVEYFYGGVVAVTPDKIPGVGRLSPRITYAYGYSGNGIVASRAIAEAVCEIVLERARQSPKLFFVSEREDGAGG